MQLLPRRVIGLAALATLLAPLFGCQFLGPSSIQAGRLSYNEVIQRTSKVQVFSNIVRVKNHEPTTFLDVVQINAGVLAQGVAMGGVTNIGLTRPGSANLSLEYQETPTIQYQPLSGAALISQIATPITTDSIANLYNGERPLASLLSFAVERLTPGYTDYASAINALIALDDLGAITITPVLLESSSGTDKKASSSSSKSDDKKQSSVLVITLLPSHPYTRGRLDQAETQRRIQSFWCRLIIVLQGTNVSCGTTRRILFSTTVPPPATVGAPPRSLSFLQTRSALGILKAATETPAPLIGFVPEAKYRVIRDRPWNLEQERKGCAGAFYTLLPEDENPLDHPTANRELYAQIAAFIRNNPDNCFYTTSEFLDPRDFEKAQLETRLAGLRRFLLIIVSENELPNAYVSYFDGKRWYSIDGADEISQKNFVLLSEFLTIQATSTPPPTLTAITVGPR